MRGRGRGLACQSDYPSDCLCPPRLFPQLDPSPPVLTQVRSVPPLRLHAQVQIDSARGTCGTCPPTQTLPAGPRSTAPKGAREGPDSLFTGDRRQPINEELLGATYRGGSARHCSEMVHCVVRQRHPAPGSARAPGGACAPVAGGVRREHRVESFLGLKSCRTHRLGRIERLCSQHSSHQWCPRHSFERYRARALRGAQKLRSY